MSIIDKKRWCKHNNLMLNNYGNFSVKRSLTKWKFLLIFNILLQFQIANGQEKIAELVAPSIKTVQFHRLGWPLSYPVIRLNSDQVLKLSFDELGSTIRDFHYTIISCDKNWNKSNLIATEFLKGIPVNPVSNFSFSFNTTFEYVHYQLTIPNEEVNITRSGNFALVVFENNNIDNPVLVKHFVVVEPLVEIIPRITKTALSTTRLAYQEIDFEVNHTGFNILDPMQEVSATIKQNGRLDNKITNLKPMFWRDGLMDFNHNRLALMEGGNEFRHLDIRSTRILSDRVQALEFIDPFFHATLFIDEQRDNSRYYYREDLNGRFHINARERENPDTEADYIFVHFSLMIDNRVPNQQIFINGALTNWQLNERSRLAYNPATGMHEITLLLKQGYYNYQFLTVIDGETSGRLSPVENSFHQTENDYLVIIYYKGLGDRNHRVIGAQTFNSLLPAPRQNPGLN